MLLAASRDALALGASRETFCGLPTGEPETHILLLGVEPPDFQPLPVKGLEYDIGDRQLPLPTAGSSGRGAFGEMFTLFVLLSGLKLRSNIDSIYNVIVAHCRLNLCCF